MNATPSGGPPPGPSETAVVDTLVLLATLQTAHAVRHATDERRAGRDPSTQEAAGFVRTFLLEASTEAADLFLRLQTGLAREASDGPEGPIAGLVRRFDRLMVLRRAANLLGTIHQRLLSLYPDVPEALVETARRLAHAPDDDALDAYAARGLAFALDLRRVLVR